MSELINIKSFVDVVVTGKKVMNKNALKGMGAAINEQFSSLSMAKILYPEDSPKKLFNRYKFLLRSFLYREKLERMYVLFNAPLLKPLSEKYPELLDKPLRPYRFAKSNAHERALMMEEHYHLLSAHFPELIEPLYLKTGITLGHFPVSSYQVVLRYDGTFRREGELTISIINERSERLYSCAFSLAGSQAQLALVIGSVQGPEPSVENASDVVRAMTKELHGLRPKSLVVMLVMILANSINAHQVLAVKKSAHVFQAKRYSKKQKSNLQSDYDELWSEFGAKELDANFVELVQQNRKSLEEIASKKRAMYRRRYEWLDLVEQNINAIFPVRILHQKA